MNLLLWLFSILAIKANFCFDRRITIEQIVGWILFYFCYYIFITSHLHTYCMGLLIKMILHMGLYRYGVVSLHTHVHLTNNLSMNLISIRIFYSSPFYYLSLITKALSISHLQTNILQLCFIKHLFIPTESWWPDRINHSLEFHRGIILFSSLDQELDNRRWLLLNATYSIFPPKTSRFAKIFMMSTIF